MPAVSSLVALAAAASAQLHDTRVLGDLERALETSPRPHLVGFSPAGIRAALNGHLEAAGHAACDAFTNEDLDELLRLRVDHLNRDGFDAGHSGRHL